MIHQIERAWYQQAQWLKVLRPFSLLFTWLAKRRRDRYLQQEGRYQTQVPVVVVGNISVGGTGKTPIVLALINFFRSQGFHPGVVSRGYGAKPPKFPWIIHSNHPAEHTGDEPLLIHLRGHVDVVIDPNRTRAVQYLLENSMCDLVISDDGLQHYALSRDVEIAVIDGTRGLGNQRCLPEGPLREPVSRLSEVDFVLQNGGDVKLHSAVHLFHLEATQMIQLGGGQEILATDWVKRLADKKVHAVCGIGNPERFYNTLSSLGLDPIPHRYEDHYCFTETDFKGLENYPIIMTEKDAVKCQGFSLNNAWVLQVDVELPPLFTEALRQRIVAIQKET